MSGSFYDDQYDKKMIEDSKPRHYRSPESIKNERIYKTNFSTKIQPIIDNLKVFCKEIEDAIRPIYPTASVHIMRDNFKANHDHKIEVIMKYHKMIKSATIKSATIYSKKAKIKKHSYLLLCIKIQKGHFCVNSMTIYPYAYNPPFSETPYESLYSNVSPIKPNRELFTHKSRHEYIKSELFEGISVGYEKIAPVTGSIVEILDRLKIGIIAKIA
jgi:hypothetical protein